MAMQKQLWSLNALAVELGKDRRTVARALEQVPADGMLRNSKAWYLRTAMGALGLGDDTGALVGDASGLVETYRHRIASWETIRQGEPPAGLPIGTVAEVLQVPVAAVLTWLRAGCPYVEAGCWQTGEGFMVSLVWTVEWRAMLAGLLAGDAATARELRLS